MKSLKLTFVTLIIMVATTGWAKEQPKHDFNTMIDTAATEQQNLATDLTAALETAPENPAAKEIADFLQTELNWDEPNDFVNNSLPEGMKARQPNSIGLPKVVAIDFNI